MVIVAQWVPIDGFLEFDMDRARRWHFGSQSRERNGNFRPARPLPVLLRVKESLVEDSVDASSQISVIVNPREIEARIGVVSVPGMNVPDLCLAKGFQADVLNRFSEFVRAAARKW